MLVVGAVLGAAVLYFFFRANPHKKAVLDGLVNKAVK